MRFDKILHQWKRKFRAVAMWTQNWIVTGTRMTMTTTQPASNKLNSKLIIFERRNEQIAVQVRHYTVCYVRLEQVLDTNWFPTK